MNLRFVKDLKQVEELHYFHLGSSLVSHLILFEHSDNFLLEPLLSLYKACASNFLQVLNYFFFLGRHCLVLVFVVAFLHLLLLLFLLPFGGLLHCQSRSFFKLFLRLHFVHNHRGEVGSLDLLGVAVAALTLFLLIFALHVLVGLVVGEKHLLDGL